MLKPFINSLIQTLKIKLPVTFTISTRENNKVDGYYLSVRDDECELIGHRIRIYMNEDTDRTLEAIIAHELIHAWQEENSDDGVHGRRFAYRARKLEAKYNLEHIYIPRTDI
jgi:hypothetical protein